VPIYKLDFLQKEIIAYSESFNDNLDSLTNPVKIVRRLWRLKNQPLTPNNSFGGMN